MDPASGRTLWSVPFVTPCDQNIVTPLRAGDVIVVSSQDTGTQAIRPVRKGAEWVPEVAWHTQEVSMYMSSPVLVNGRVIGLSHRKKGQYFALDPATGTVQWKSEPGQGENAAFVLAHGALLVLEGDGTLLVLPPDAAAFSPTRRYRVAESATFAHPVPTDLGILVKDENGLSLYGREPRSASRAGRHERAASAAGDVRGAPGAGRRRGTVAEIYNQGIAERGATFETDPRTPADLARRIEEDPERFPVLVAEEAGSILGWASIGPYRTAAATRAWVSSPSTSIATLEAAASGGSPGAAPRGGARAAATGSSCRASSPRTRPASPSAGPWASARWAPTRSTARLDGRWLDVVIVERLIPENQP